jgi:hypothetical protein
MKSINAYYNGDIFVPLEKPVIQPNQKVIITILDEFFGKQNTPVKPFEKYVGKLDNESFAELENALTDCEKVDLYEW